MFGFWVSGGGGAETWTELTDTPASITADRAVKGDGAGTALEFAANPYLDTTAAAGYLRRDGSNTITGVITADGDQTRSFGAGATRFDRMHGRLLTALGASTETGAKSGTDVGTRTYGANPTGVIGGNMVEYGAGVAYFRHGQAGGASNPFKPVMTVGNVFAGYYGGDANLRNNGGGSFIGGSVYTYGAGDCSLVANSFGSFTWAYSYGLGGNPHDWINQGSGSVMVGYSQGSGTIAVTNSGEGCFTAVRPKASNPYTSTVTNSGSGAFVNGYLNAAGGSCLLEATGSGSFAQGTVFNGSTIAARNAGAFAQGDTRNAGSSIVATGQGTFAHGRTRGGFSISAVGRGALAIGDAAGAAITASAGNASQFGPGVNSDTVSLQVGTETQLFGATGRIRFTGILETDPTTVTGTTHTAADEHVILVDDDTAGSAVTVTLPLAATADAMYYVKKLGTTANVIVDGNGAETVDGAANATLTLQYEAVLVVSNGSAWFVL